MIKSMTGFGAGDCENDDFKVHVEIKSVNQRFLELNLHMHHSLSMFENAITKKVKEYCTRGKMDLNMSFQDKRDKEAIITVDKGLVAGYANALREIGEQLGVEPNIRVSDITRFPDVLRVTDADTSLEEAQPVIIAALQQALEHLISMRVAEGENIQADLLARIDTLEGYTAQLEGLAPVIVANYKAKVEALLEEVLARTDIDENRVIQEVALFTDKVNYTEEMVRLHSHFDQFRQLITSDQPVGRKLDFLIQEMNREINTCASKANSAGAAQVVVDVKSEIEKIREQIQNIE